MFVCTGQSGVAVSAALLTAGDNPAADIGVTTTTSVFTTSGPPFRIGGGSFSSPQGSVNTTIIAFWPSVLSAQDQSIAEAWMRKVGAKQAVNA